MPLTLPKSVSYRQFNHWVERGWIIAENAGAGPGVQRSLAPDEERVLSAMGDLVSDGVKPERAASLARLLVGYGYARLGNFYLVDKTKVRTKENRA